MIDQATIQKIFDAADILDVVQDFVSLKKRGVNYVGCCPFHNEKTGSFTVSPAKGIYKCFGCGKGGNSVNFIMEHEQMSYVEALRYLAAKFHIPIEEKQETKEELQRKSDREAMLMLSEFAQSFFVENLNNTQEGRTVGLHYFMDRRGLDKDTIEKFGLGYCPDKYNALCTAAESKGYNRELLVKTGLGIASEKGIFDRFRARVIFPIRNIAGKIIGFGGRIMTADKKAAKYQNSPESEIYHKSNTLYGIFYAKRSIVQKNTCYLVEGYLDVISFHMRGIENTVASSGTSLTIEQIHLIRRLTPNVTIIYDGDAAGIKASLRGIDLVLKEGLNVRIVSLPEGEDPDSFAQSHTKAEIEQYIEENETDFIGFKTKLLLEAAGEDPIEKAKVINDIVKSISIISDDITRAVFIQSTAKRLGVSENSILATVSKLRNENHIVQSITTQRRPDPTPLPPHNPYKEEEFVLIKLLILYGEQPYGEMDGKVVSVGDYILENMDIDGLHFFEPLYENAAKLFRQHRGDAGFVSSRFYSLSDDTALTKLVADVMSEPYEMSNKLWKDSAGLKKDMDLVMDILPKAIFNYKARVLEIKALQIDKKIAQLTTSNSSDDEVFKWLQIKQQIAIARLKLNAEMGRS